MKLQHIQNVYLGMFWYNNILLQLYIVYVLRLFSGVFLVESLRYMMDKESILIKVEAIVD